MMWLDPIVRFNIMRCKTQILLVKNKNKQKRELALEWVRISTQGLKVIRNTHPKVGIGQSRTMSETNLGRVIERKPNTNKEAAKEKKCEIVSNTRVQSL